jgi:hypothetical protein
VSVESNERFTGKNIPVAPVMKMRVVSDVDMMRSVE